MYTVHKVGLPWIMAQGWPVAQGRPTLGQPYCLAHPNVLPILHPCKHLLLNTSYINPYTIFNYNTTHSYQPCCPVGLYFVVKQHIKTHTHQTLILKKCVIPSYTTYTPGEEPSKGGTSEVSDLNAKLNKQLSKDLLSTCC